MKIKNNKFLLILTEDPKFKPDDKDWMNNGILFESNLATNKAAALSYFKKNELFLKYEKKVFIHIKKIKSSISNTTYKITSVISVLLEKKKSEEAHRRSELRKALYASLSIDEKEKILSKNRVNRPKLKSGKKAPAWFVELLKLPKGKYLAKDIAIKLGISDRNLKIVLRKRGIEPAGTELIAGYHCAYYHTSQFKELPREDIEEAKKKLE